MSAQSGCRSPARTRTGGHAGNPLDEAGGFKATSTVLPPDEFPQFRSSEGGDTAGAGPFDPVEGSWYIAGPHVDDSYVRLTRTVDLTGVTAAAGADAPGAAVNYSTRSRASTT